MTAAALQWVTPLPPAASGIAQYSRDLLDALDGEWNVAVLAEAGSHVRPWRTVRARIVDRRSMVDPALPVVYQLGNSAFHRFGFQAALETPGVLVLHDVVLHFGRLGEFLRSGGGADYQRTMQRIYGAHGAQVARAVLRGHAPAEIGAYPLCEDYVRSSQLTLVHSDYARERVLELAPDADVRHIPMGVPLPYDMPRDEARRALELPPDAFVIASITHVNPYKRLPVVLRALRRIARAVPEALLVVAGSVAPGSELDSDIGYLGLQGRVRQLGYVSDAQARWLAAAADVCVNLRYPSAGETSASLLRLLGAGRPVIVTDDTPNAEYPDDVVLKVPVDRLEEEMIAALLLDMHDTPSLAVARGRRARAYVAREHTMGRALAGYRAAVRDVYGVELPDLDNLATAEPLMESIRVGPAPTWGAFDAVVADSIAECGLAGHAPTMARVSRVMVELGLHRYGKHEEHRMDEQQLIRPDLLEILACPVCKARVRLDGQQLVCESCGRRYPIEDGIPIMLVEDEK